MSPKILPEYYLNTIIFLFRVWYEPEAAAAVLAV